MMYLMSFTLVTALAAAQSTPYQLNDTVKRLLSAGENSAAVGVARQAASSAEVKLGPADPATAMMLRNLALAYLGISETGRAEASAKRALAILEARFSSSDVSLVPVLNVLTETYTAEGRFDDACAVAERAVGIGPDAGPHYAIARHNLKAITQLERRYPQLWVLVDAHKGGSCRPR